MSRNTIFRLNFYLLDCTRTCLFPHNNHVRSIQRIKKGRARERALKSFLKWMVSLPWHGRGSPFSSLPPSLSRPQSMKVQMGGNDVALFTFFHTRATTRRESGLWPALNRRRGDGRHRRFSSFPFSFTPFVTDSKNFWILISPKLLLPLKVYLYSTGTREEEEEETGASVSLDFTPKRVPSTTHQKFRSTFD